MSCAVSTIVESSCAQVKTEVAKVELEDKAARETAKKDEFEIFGKFGFVGLALLMKNAFCSF